MVLVMTPNLLRQLWTLIDNNQSNFVFKLDDQSLILSLTQQLGEKQPLSFEEEAEARSYIQSRLLLIRDVA